MRRGIKSFLKRGKHPSSEPDRTGSSQTQEPSHSANDTDVERNDHVHSKSVLADTPPIEQGDNLGVKLLYQPENPKDARADIVFVHGLAGNAFSTWYYKEHALHWPSTLLKEDIPEARIFIYGYDANVASFWGGASQNRLVNHAESMVGHLVGRREDTNTEDRKIVFVAHSLGGLVVERALQLSENSAEKHLRQIENSTVGIAFLGTPHAGSGFAPFAKSVGKALSFLGKRVNTDILEALKRDSQILLDVEDWFGHWRRRRAETNPVQITCFFEELELPAFGKVVEETQARIAGYSSYGIHANHMNMTKFSGTEDPGYRAVSRELRRWVRAASEQQAKAVRDPKREERVNKFLAKLYTCPYEERKNVNDDRVPGTCQWFTHHEKFKHWNESTESCLLWVSADPGCGKSVLAKYLVDEVIPSQEKTICYFFFKDGFLDQQSASNAICAILRQLFRQKPHLLSDGVLSRSEQDKDTFCQSFSGLWSIFTRVTSEKDAGEVVCILEALDECRQGDLKQLGSEIRRLFLLRRDSRLKLLLTSRPYQHIRWEFQALEDLMPTIHLAGANEVEVEKITNEIDLVIRSRVKAIAAKRRLRKDERTHLENLMTSIPNRTYLWVTLTLDVIERISGFTRGNVVRTVQKLPKTVDEAYEKILQKSPDAQQALKALRIVTAATEPLSVKEMSFAMAIQESHKTFHHMEEELEPESRFQDTLRDLCGLFLVVINERLYLLHQTAREFLVRNSGPGEPPEDRFVVGDRNKIIWKHSIDIKVSNGVLAQACVWYLILADAYLSFSEADFSPISYDRPLVRDDILYGFSRYAFDNWNVHFRRSNIESKNQITQAALQLCQRQSDPLYQSRFGTHNEIMSPLTGPSSGNPLSNPMSTAAVLGVYQVVQLLLDTKESDAAATGTDTRTPLSYAAERGHVGVVEVLIAPELADLDHRDEDGMTPLHYAAKRGHQKVAALLLRAGKVNAQVVATDYLRQTPLALAVAHGQASVVDLLVATGQGDINLGDQSGRTPLMDAIDLRRTEIAKMLLQTSEVDVNAKDKDGRTALRIAAKAGHEEIVRLLLRMGKVDVNAKDPTGRTGLMIAAKHGRKEIVRLLLRTENVDVNKSDDSGMTALITAARCGRKGIVRRLLQTGTVDVNAADIQGNTAFTHAALAGDERITRLLLQTGLVDVNATNLGGETALILAAGHKFAESVVQVLLQTGKVDVNARVHGDADYRSSRIRDGDTALIYAAAQGNEEIVRLLLQTRAVDISIANVEGETAFSCAVDCQHPGIVRLLLETEQVELDEVKSALFPVRMPHKVNEGRGVREEIERLLMRYLRTRGKGSSTPNQSVK